MSEQTKTDYLNDLTEIRSLMERSSRFLSLSGLSGVFAGFFALGGAAVAYMLLYRGRVPFLDGIFLSSTEIISYLLLDAVVVLLLAVSTGIYFTVKNTRKRGEKIWHSSMKMWLFHLLLPLVAGGLFCLELFYWGVGGLVPGATLIFYGLALVNAGKFTHGEIRQLGVLEIGLGILSSFFVGYGLLFWSVGFGLLHILYGIIMYQKYERERSDK
ncbi:hypothetical protein R9C00_01045 [Flammeovirgaceae bacterium SG7u.111]|nr:hypothetical protein [Flammeovirgaceae bacterium SG7u.132]WPO36034.1 hypothetical protein R9C00_01045 [Flammeovirgaceae bacterium SG7u.111]